MRPLPRRLALLSLAAAALGAFALPRPAAEGGDGDGRPVEHVRLTVHQDGLLRLKEEDVARRLPARQDGTPLFVAPMGGAEFLLATGPGIGEDEIAIVALGTHGRSTSLELHPMPGPHPKTILLNDGTTAVERFTWDDDRVFGDVAAALPEVYDRAVPHWFLARLEKGRIVDLPVGLPPPGPVDDSTVTIAVDIAPTHEGLVRLRATWGETDLGPAIAVKTDVGARVSWSMPAKGIPPPGTSLRIYDWTEELPPLPAQDVSDDRGVVWIDAVTVTAPMKPHAGLRFVAPDGVRVRLEPVLPVNGLRKAPRGRGMGVGGQAEMVILSTNALLPGARKLAEHRTRTGIETAVIPISDVLDASGGGPSAPDTIRRTLQSARRHLPRLRFVLLCGDATRDRTDLIDEETIPTAYVRTVYNGATPSDRWLALPSDDATTGALAIGRLPFRDPKEMDAYVDRVILAETTPRTDAGRRTLRFVTSEGRFGPTVDAALEGLFTKVVAENISPAYDVEVTFANPKSSYCWPPSRFHEKVISSLNEGSLFYTYVGHGFAQGFDALQVGDSRYPILRSSDVPQVSITGTPPAMFVIACTTATFDAPNEVGVGERLLARPNGPLAYWGATRVCHPLWNSLVGRQIAIDAFEKPDLRLGELLNASVDQVVKPDPARKDPQRGLIELVARNMLAGTVGADRLYLEGSWMYVLLGDPALELPRPREDLVPTATRTATGLSVKVEGALPDGAEVEMTVEVPRNAIVKRESKAGGTPDEKMAARHANSNDKALARARGTMKGGLVTFEVEVPEGWRTRALVVKASAVAGGDVHVGGIRMAAP